jgi:hypothetical protein
LEKRLSALEKVFVLPTGFSKLFIGRDNFEGIRFLEKTFNEPYCTASIIEPIDKDFKKLVQMDPLSPYQHSFCDLTKDKISLGLEIDKIPHENFNFTFLHNLITLRTVKISEEYVFSDIYEVILPKLNGKGILKTDPKDFVTLEEKGLFGLPWALVKNVIIYFIIKSFPDSSDAAQELYDKLICEFQFNLLISSFEKFQSVKEEDKEQYQFLINEMFAKVAYDAANVDGINREIIADYLVDGCNEINADSRSINAQKYKASTIGKISFNKTNFQDFLPKDLRNLQFIKQNISKNFNHFAAGAIRNQYKMPAIQDKILKHEDLLKIRESLNGLAMLYGLNRAIQIADIIENFVFAVSKHNTLQSWYGDDNNTEAAKVIVQMANLYYNCSAIIFSELFPDQEKSYYDPTYYTKLVLVLFGLNAMVESLLRADKKLGQYLSDYSISTELNEIVSLKNIISQLSIPTKKWIPLARLVYKSFDKDFSGIPFENLEKKLSQPSSNSKNRLFHYSSLNISDYPDKTNTDVIFMLKLLRESYPERSKLFDEDMQNKKVEERATQWKSLLFDNKYLPELLLHLRDVSYLSRFSLCGFSTKTIDKMNNSAKNYNKRYEYLSLNFSKGDPNSPKIYFGGSGIPCYPPRIFDLCCYKESRYDKNRFVNFVLPKGQEKYQRLMFQERPGFYYTENEIISTQNDKPDNLTKPQYYALGLIPIHENLKFIHLYVALKNQDLSFETEEHCYLIKKCLHTINFMNNEILIERKLKNREFAPAIVSQFINVALDLKERTTQTRSIGHVLDLLLFIYDFSSESDQYQIQKSLRIVIDSLLKNINEQEKSFEVNNYRKIVSALHAYSILSYKNIDRLSEEDVSSIMKSRVVIENNSRLQSKLSFDLYAKVMSIIFSLSNQIEDIISRNLKILNEITPAKGNWIRDADKNIYTESSYAFMPLKGRLYKNGLPVSGLPDYVYNNQNYQECFGKKQFLVSASEREFCGKKLSCYENQEPKDTNFRITPLENNYIWIEKKDNDTGAYQTFIPKFYFEKLPKFLIENCYSSDTDQKFYSHWYEEDKVFIKEDNQKTRFEIDLKNDEIYSSNHKQFLFPFKNGFDELKFLYNIFSKFEDENYILGLKEIASYKNPVKLHLPRLNLNFQFERDIIVSDDFKDYRLSHNQHVNTLDGLSQYLSLEPNIDEDNPIRLNKKMIIPFHPIQKDGNSFFSKKIKFDLKKFGKPTYFSYDIDEKLGSLVAETTAGSLYLALLYFKTASLDRDLLTGMNGYDTCSQILNTCWQNSPYTEEEFNIIFKFFSHDEQVWRDYSKSDDNFIRLEAKHPNLHAIYLKLISMLLSSYYTDFLKSNPDRKQFCDSYFNSIFSYHFNFYLISKDKISDRCKLSIEDEKKTLAFFFKNNMENYQFGFDRINNYFNFIDGKKNITIKSNTVKNHNTIEDSIFSADSFEKYKFKEATSLFFNREFSYDQNYSSTSLTNQNLSIGDTVDSWVSKQFDP